MASVTKQVKVEVLRRSSVGKVTAGLAKSNCKIGNLPPGMTQNVPCGVTAYTPGSAPVPTLGMGALYLYLFTRHELTLFKKSE